ncbi:hypothetical protein mRhiFer1_007869 [Rhinolophus ferrumequinum]|uniref:Core shell protein Gag P30 domain-containing protein n=1 Tax=Rhinolophus ferrumequinum TaxID=59479 RepID=A0A7J8AVP4_RHIFE|nr:hypothetical protein mRhiFer1_007869 [Rhinolophus ferrumequinum]
MMDLSRIESKLGSFSSGPSHFTKGLEYLTLSYDLTWRDIDIILSTCTNSDERNRIIRKAREIADSMHRQNNSTYPPGETTVPSQDPNWNYQTHPQPNPDRLKRDRIVNCLLQGMKAAIQKDINYEKVRKIYKDHHENPAVFLSRLSEALQNYTNINLDSLDSRAVLAMHFISQSAPDICRKLQKLEKWPHTP